VIFRKQAIYLSRYTSHSRIPVILSTPEAVFATDGFRDFVDVLAGIRFSLPSEFASTVDDWSVRCLFAEFVMFAFDLEVGVGVAIDWASVRALSYLTVKPAEMRDAKRKEPSRRERMIEHNDRSVPLTIQFEQTAIS